MPATDPPAPRPGRRFAKRYAWLLALVAGSANAGQITLDLQGIEGPLHDAVAAGVEIAHYGDREVTAAQARRLFDRAGDQARVALEPFGFFNPVVDGNLEERGEDFVAVLRVEAGEPTLVKALDISIGGAADGQAEVRKAVAAFAPALDQPLDQPAYEKSKAAIQSALFASGYLDAKLTLHQVEVRRSSASAAIKLAWDVGARYRFGATRFEGGQFDDAFMKRYIPWREGDFYTQDKLLEFQQRLIDADYFAVAQVQPDAGNARDGVIPIQVGLAPAKRTVYTGGVFVGTDTGPGVRGGIERRWVNRRGHKARLDVLAAQRLKTAAALYQIPLAGHDNHSLNFGINFRDEDTDTSTSRTFGLAATDSRIWHGWTRQMGLKYLTGNFKVANIQGDTTLLYPEVSLARKHADDPMFVRDGWSLTMSARAAQEGLLSKTSFIQASADAKWIRGIGEKSRFIARGSLGTTAVDDFSRMPPELRFFAGGDRSIRGYGYQTVGPPLAPEYVPAAEAWCAAHPDTSCQSLIAGGRNLIVASAEYEYYFLPDWGIAAFIDTGDAFNDPGDYTQKTGVGLGARWRSPVGMVRVDLGFPVGDKDNKGVELHIVIGPDL